MGAMGRMGGWSTRSRVGRGYLAEAEAGLEHTLVRCGTWAPAAGVDDWPPIAELVLLELIPVVVNP